MKQQEAKRRRQGTTGSGPSGGSRRWWRAPMLAVAVVVLAAVAVLSVRQYWSADGAEPAAGREGGVLIGGPFSLTDQDGRAVTDADFRGRWMLVYFGFTFCPDVCPTSLNRNSEALDLLGDKADAIVPVLITIDPQRDTPEKLKDYVHFFHPRTVGLTGTPEQIAAVAREYRVFYVRAEHGAPDQYLMDHSTFTYLIGPDGKFVQFFRHDTPPQEMAERIKALL